MAEPLTRLKLYKTGGKAPLTDLLPLFEQLGLTVVEEVPTRLQDDDDQGRYLHDFGVLGSDGRPLDLARLGTLVADTVSAVWDGRAGSDWLNRLVVAGGLDWRQVTILRAYRQYRQLLGGSSRAATRTTAWSETTPSRASWWSCSSCASTSTPSTTPPAPASSRSRSWPTSSR